ncbi:MAG: signal peptidase I [Pseudoxanthomonas suwonensis]|nr:signal peptidase I [Pseudoxanthomonas suwonensis]
MHPPESTKRSRLAGWRGEALRMGLLLALLLVFRSSFANHYVVPSGSMQPALQPGDRVLVDMRAYGWRLPLGGPVVWPADAPREGDIAVFASPHDGTRLIKRIVALPGQRVAVRDGRLWVDGRSRAVPGPRALDIVGTQAVELDMSHGGGPELPDMVVPAGHALVVGDHRGNSFDGRQFGLVPLSAFRARALGVYWRRGEGLAWHRLTQH